MEPVRCKECGARACICSDSDYDKKGNEITETIKWAAHCMDCDNTTGHRSFYDPIHKTEEEAIEAWNKLNEKGER